MNVSNALKVVALGTDPQSFLDAGWIPRLLDATPLRWQRQVALGLLGLSPHYFHRRFQPGLTGVAYREAEFARNMATRRAIGERVLLPLLTPSDTALDFGCGPGFLSRFVAEHVSRVYAVDISRGALACGRILNGTPNTTFVRGFENVDEPVDLVYSFAVFQHMTDLAVARALSTLREALRPGGRLVAHVVIDEPGWRSEQQQRRDRSIGGRLRLRYALNCFSRSEGQMQHMVAAAGFRDIAIEPLRARFPEPIDDICRQHLVTAVA